MMNMNVIEEQIFKERLKQLILQSVSFRDTVRLHSIFALEVDGEPRRCVVFNETFTIEDRIRLWAQTAALPLLASSQLALNNIGTAAAAASLNGHALSATTEETAMPDEVLLPSISPQPLTLGAADPTAVSSGPTNKRKPVRPMKIPQNGFEEPQLGLPKDDDAMDEAALISKTLRNILNNSSNNNSLPRMPQLTAGTFPLKNESKDFEGNDHANAADFLPALPVFPTAKISFSSETRLPLPKKKPKGVGAVGGALPSSKKSNSSKVFACNQCKEKFSSLNLLCKHTFSSHRAFRCTICGANFTQRSNLQRHSLKHVGFKPFICNVCTKAYYRKDHLVRHIEVTHPQHDPKSSITVKLTSSECLDYLERMNKENGDESKGSPAVSDSCLQEDSPMTGTTPAENSQDVCSADYLPLHIEDAEMENDGEIPETEITSVDDTMDETKLTIQNDLVKEEDKLTLETDLVEEVEEKEKEDSNCMTKLTIENGLTTEEENDIEEKEMTDVSITTPPPLVNLTDIST